MSLAGLFLDLERRFETVAAESISQDPSKSLIAALDGGPGAAGVPVTQTTVAGLPVVYACDRVIREDVAKTPIKLMRRLPDGRGREADTDHPIYSLLHDLANPVMTAFDFKETLQSQLNLWGNAYAEIVRNRRNEVTALWPLESSRMTVDLNGLNQLRYTYRLPTGRTKVWIFDPANPPVLHLRQHAIDGIHGRGPVQVLREAMGVAVASQRYQARHFGQGGHARVGLSTPSALSEEAAKRVRRDFEAMTVGEHNWHRVVVMDHDLKPVPLAMPHRDAQFIETLKLGRSELSGAFRVPSHKINDLDKATFSNIEHQAIEWVTDGLMPHFVRWTQAIARDLLNPKSFNTHFAVFVVDALVRGDMKTQTEALAVQRQNGVISTNDWRRLMDQNPIAVEDGGDDYLVNGNMVPVRRDPAAVIGLETLGTTGAN